jgi:protein-disulfide isomerase
MTIDRLSNLLFPAACAVIIVVGALHLHDRVWPQRQAADTEPVSGMRIDLSEIVTLREGNPNLVVIELSDLQCPYCAKYDRETFPRLREKFVKTGKIAYAFVHSPIEEIHPLAVEAGAAAECAAEQGGFWPFRSAMFERQADVTRSSILSIGSIGHRDLPSQRY